MTDLDTADSKVDKAAARMYTATGFATAAASYGALSLPGYVEPSSLVTYQGKFSSLINGVAGVNDAISFFLDNALSVQIPGNVLGSVVGFGCAAIAVLYSRSQRRKISTFRTQADEIRGKKQGGPTADKGLIP